MESLSCWTSSSARLWRGTQRDLNHCFTTQSQSARVTGTFSLSPHKLLLSVTSAFYFFKYMYLSKCCHCHIVPVSRLSSICPLFPLSLLYRLCECMWLTGLLLLVQCFSMTCSALVCRRNSWRRQEQCGRPVTGSSSCQKVCFKFSS